MPSSQLNVVLELKVKDAHGVATMHRLVNFNSVTKCLSVLQVTFIFPPNHSIGIYVYHRIVIGKL